MTDCVELDVKRLKQETNLFDIHCVSKCCWLQVHGLVNLCDGAGNSPLFYCCCVAGATEAVVLLNAGADPNAANQVSFVLLCLFCVLIVSVLQHALCPLWIALQNNDADLCLSLFARNVEIDRGLGPHGNTILMWVFVCCVQTVHSVVFDGSFCRFTIAFLPENRATL
jgi:hypothetical protein